MRPNIFSSVSAKKLNSERYFLFIFWLWLNFIKVQCCNDKYHQHLTSTSDNV